MMTAPSPTHRTIARACVLVLLVSLIGLHIGLAWPAARPIVLGMLGGAGAALACSYLIVRRLTCSARAAGR